MTALNRILPIVWATLFVVAGALGANAGSIPNSEVETAIIAHLEATCAVPGMEIEFLVPRAANISVPDCDHPRVTVSHDPVELPVRSIPVTVTVANESGETIRNLRQVVRLRFFTMAVVAAADIKNGEVLTPAQFAIERVDVTGVDEYFTSLDGFDGLQAKKYLRTGAVLSGDMVRPVYLVDRGDKVAVEVRDGAFTIRTEGTARQGGSMGETISVYIDMTRTTVSGVVINEETVLTGATGG